MMTRTEHSLKVALGYWEHPGASNCDAAVNDLAELLDRELQAQHERTATLMAIDGVEAVTRAFTASKGNPRPTGEPE